jgi:hypothetical protein
MSHLFSASTQIFFMNRDFKSIRSALSHRKRMHFIRVAALGFVALWIGLHAFSASAQESGGGTATYSEDKRFIDHGDQTITDTETGLMWMKQDSYQYKGHWLDWFEAARYVDELNETAFANHIDWQLPTVEELTSLFQADKLNSMQLGSEMKIHIDPIFAKKGSGSHWTSEPNGNYNAFGVEFNSGGRFNKPKKGKSRRAVRAVRRNLR